MNYSSTNQFTTNNGYRNHLVKTYAWMFFGVAITFLTAFYTANSFTLLKMIYGNSILSFVFLFAQLGIVMFLGARLMNMSSLTAKIMFIVYAILTGLTFSVIMLSYGLGSVFSAFALASLYFGSLAVIGATTKKDLSTIGTIAMAALFAMIIYSIISFFIPSLMNNFVYSLIGLVVFAGITAWDSQKIKAMYAQAFGNPELLDKLSIYSALQLYLDFINIFLYIIRIIGRRDD